MRASALLSCLLLAACAKPPMVAPEPVSLASPLPPVAAVQRVAQRLTMEGFTIATSDATGGILTATLTKQGKGSWAPFVQCNFSDDSGAHVWGGVTLTLRMTAQASGAGSAVYLATDAVNGVQAGMLSRQGKSDCASTGEIEKRIAAALTGA